MQKYDIFFHLFYLISEINLNSPDGHEAPCSGALDKVNGESVVRY